MEKTKVAGSYNPFSAERKGRETYSGSGTTSKACPHWIKSDEGGRIRDERPPSQTMTERAYGGIRKPSDKCISDGVTPRNPFVAEKRRLTWSNDVHEKKSKPSQQLMQLPTASSKAGAGSQTNTFQREIQMLCIKDGFDSFNGQTERGYELPLTPISAEKFVLDAMSMTVGANKGARSKHYTKATEADVVDNVKLSNKNAISTLQVQSEHVF
jgi:hypothetical protein